jgi:hypothetical protein
VSPNGGSVSGLRKFRHYIESTDQSQGPFALSPRKYPHRKNSVGQESKKETEFSGHSDEENISTSAGN